ncbi:hypothetical protein KY358_06890 [Candidatus Woesearchaeota archaeon]|nr:hypothetical protein [Candidatus Woesearchaeota archaeon]
MAGKTIIFILLVILFSSIASASYWVSDPFTCPKSDPAFLGVLCSYDSFMCGGSCYSGNINTPSIASESFTLYSPSLGGGYILDCFSIDDTEPYCNNDGNLWCNADPSCTSLNRMTRCTADAWEEFVCSGCMPGFVSCSGDYADADGCEIEAGVTPYTEPNVVYYHDVSCYFDCKEGYHDCDGDVGTDGNGCEIQDGISCMKDSSEGVYSGCYGNIGNCEVAKFVFETGSEVEYPTEDPLLWGEQKGGGPILNLASQSGIFRVTNMGDVAIGTTDSQGELHIEDSNTATIHLEESGQEEWEYRAVTSGHGLYEDNVPRMWFEEGNGHVLINPLGGGNVGIGTTGPEGKLHVDDGEIVIVPDSFGGTARRSSDDSNIITGVGTTSDYVISVQDGTGRVQHYWNAEPSEETYLVSGEEAGKILFSPSTNAWLEFDFAGEGTAGNPITWDRQFVIQQDGNVGIGITNPSQRLDVNGQIHATGDICTDTACLNSAGSWTSGIGDEIYRLSGNVGIGTASPGAALDIDGTVRMQDFTSCTALETDAAGNIVCGTDDSGLGVETDPTVPAAIKDGISWTELSGIPAGFADGTDADTKLTDPDIAAMGYIKNADETDPTVTLAKLSSLVLDDFHNLGGVDADTKLTDPDIAAMGYIKNADESDPTVLASVKDGVSWPEIIGRPAGLDDGDDDTTCAVDGTCPGMTYDSETLAWDKNSADDITTANIGFQNVDKVDGFDLDQDVRTTSIPSFAGLEITGDLHIDEPGRLLLDTGQVVPVSSVSIQGHHLPESDGQFDLGSSSKRWRDGYFGGNINIQDAKMIHSDGNNLRFAAGGFERWRVEGTGSRLVGGAGAARGASIRGEAGAETIPNYAFNNDLSTGMWSPAASTIALSTDGSEAVRIDNDGNVGIGTSSPTGRLQVIGSGETIGMATFNNGWLQIGTSAGGITIDPNELYSSGEHLNLGTITSHDIRFNLNGNTNAVIKPDGKVGIGTGSPAGKLHVKGTDYPITKFERDVGDSTSAAWSVQDLTVTTTGTPQEDMAVGQLFNLGPSGNIGRLLFAQGSTSGQYGKFKLQLAKGGNPNSNTILTALDNGNVGIGTTDPQAKLDIIGNELRIEHTSPQIKFTDTDHEDYWIHANSDRLYFLWDELDDGDWDSPHPLYLHGRNAYFDSSTLVVDGSANRVGIGTTSPATTLDVNGGASFNGIEYKGRSEYSESDIIWNAQPYIEAERWPWIGTPDSYVTVNSPDAPYGKVAKSTSYDTMYSDYMPVHAGETLYGEIWAMRDVGASGTAGFLYMGIERYDKDKKAIAGNSGCTYFVASAKTVPADGVWHKYSGYTTLSTSHMPYSGSDGGPVRYIRVRILVDYDEGTIPTYWSGMKIRRVKSPVDEGNVAFGGNVGIGTTTPAENLHISGEDDSDYTSVLISDAGLGADQAARLEFNNFGMGHASIRNRLEGGTHALIFDVGGAADMLALRSNGNVGIGTTDPGESLEVVGNMQITGDPNGPKLYFQSSNTGIWFDNSENKLKFAVGGFTDRLTIEGITGDVGIGTTDPKARLDIDGDVALRGQEIIDVKYQLVSSTSEVIESPRCSCDTTQFAKECPDTFSASSSDVTSLCYDQTQNSLPPLGIPFKRVLDVSFRDSNGDEREGGLNVGGGIKNVDGVTSLYSITLKRYHVEATKARVENTVPLDMDILKELCADEDGCQFTIGMRDWTNDKPGLTALRGPYRLFMSKTSNWWRTDLDIQDVNVGSHYSMEGADGNGVVNHVFGTWGCYFTDGEYAASAGSDNSVQLGLLNTNGGGYNDPDMVCILTFDD